MIKSRSEKNMRNITDRGVNTVPEPIGDAGEILSPAVQAIFWGFFYAFGVPFVILLAVGCSVALIDKPSFLLALFFGYPLTLIAMFGASMVMRANRIRGRYAAAQITILLVWIPFIALFALNLTRRLTHPVDEDRSFLWVESILVLPLTFLAAIVPIAVFRTRRAANKRSIQT